MGTKCTERFLGMLGLARRAGKLCYGFDSVAENINSLYAVFTASDSSPKTIKNIDYILSEKNIQSVATNYTKTELGYAIGRKPCGIIGVTDSGFSRLLKARLSTEVSE